VHSGTQQRTKALVIRESKAALGLYLCMMNPWSGCGEMLSDAETAKSRKPKRGCCQTDYMVLYDLVKDRLITWEQAEEAGMCRPRRRQTQKRVLMTLTARNGNGN